MTDEQVADTHETGCCVVGGGPAGMILSYLLARKNVPVTLLEAHHDFDRDFRGDTVHPSTLEILDQLGLADRLLQLPHSKIQALKVTTGGQTFTMIRLDRLRTKFPYIAMLPQAKFLDFMAEEAKKLPSFQLVLGANVQRLVEENGVVRGVRYRGGDDAWHEVRAPLTVGADGRFSKLRGLAGLEPVKSAPPMDVLWFRLPRKAEDPLDAANFYIGGGVFVILLDRGEDWQVGYVIAKGSYRDLKSAGIEALRKSLAEQVPWLAGRVERLHDWDQVAVLSVESSRLPTWHKPGLLLIGDAAHVMTPVGGVGINYAVQDAVETANLLAGPLQAGQVTTEQLAEVQKAREWPTKVIQAFQGLIQRKVVSTALAKDQPFKLPLLFRIITSLPVIRNFPANLVAFGPRRVRVKM